MYETAVFLLSFRHICIRNHQNIEYDSRLHHHVWHLLWVQRGILRLRAPHPGVRPASRSTYMRILRIHQGRVVRQRRLFPHHLHHRLLWFHPSSVSRHHGSRDDPFLPRPQRQRPQLSSRQAVQVYGSPAQQNLPSPHHPDPRHLKIREESRPSQLVAAALHAPLMFSFLWWLEWKRRAYLLILII